VRRFAAALILSLAAAALTSCGGSGSSALPERTSSPVRSQPTVEAPTNEATTAVPRPTLSVRASGPVVGTTTAPPPAVPTTAPSPAASESSDDVPWGWIIAAIVIVIAVIGIVVLAQQRRRRGRVQTWLASTAAAADRAQLARTLLPAPGQPITDIANWQAVRVQIEQAASDLDAAAATAPTSDRARAVQDTAGAIRNVAFALESERLLSASTPPPTAAQLGEADAVVREARATADASLATLERLVHPQPGSPGPTRS